MQTVLRIGTRDSQLAVWQATLVQNLLKEAGVASELVFIKSEGDLDTVTPLYALGVQGVFTKTLDTALLNNRIDIAVHSMKDVPTQLAQGIQQAAVLKRASHKDIFVAHPEAALLSGYSETTHAQTSLNHDDNNQREFTLSSVLKRGEAIPQGEWTIATGSIRRIAQWLNRYPNHKVENLRGNVNTRLRKLKESNWQGAIFAAAGLERINLRPGSAIDLDWMLPAPAQGAIIIVCREGDAYAFESSRLLNDEVTALCTRVERDFLSALMGGCSTPISAFAEVKSNGTVYFKGNMVTPDGKDKVETEANMPWEQAGDIGKIAAKHILAKGGQSILNRIRNKGLSADGEV